MKCRIQSLPLLGDFNCLEYLEELRFYCDYYKNEFIVWWVVVVVVVEFGVQLSYYCFYVRVDSVMDGTCRHDHLSFFVL